MAHLETDRNFWTKSLLGEEPEEGGSYVLSGTEYQFRDHILRQAAVSSPNQEQTAGAFTYKWARRSTYESGALQSYSLEWLVERYLDGNMSRLGDLFPPMSRVLDAGCGAGHCSR